MRSTLMIAAVSVATMMAGCTTLPSDQSTQATTLDTLDIVNVVQGYKPGCDSKNPSGCHPVYPTRAQIEKAHWLSCTGYVMAKAYALADKGIARDRMLIATFSRADTPKESHAVLVVDGQYVLDNMTPGIRTFDEYARFNPVVRATPWKD